MTVPGGAQRALVIGEALIDIVEREGPGHRRARRRQPRSTSRWAWPGWVAASTSSPILATIHVVAVSWTMSKHLVCNWFRAA